MTEIELNPEASRLASMAASEHAERARRAQIVLLSREGRSDSEIAELLRISRKTAWRWRTRYLELGIDGIATDRKRTGRKPRVHDQVASRIIETTLHVAPPQGIRWSTRQLAEFLGVSRSMVHRVWRKNGIAPPENSSETPPLNSDIAQIRDALPPE